MYKPNKKHLQPALISAASELPEKQLKRLKTSWADTFYGEFFCRINEEIFSVLYSSEPSRPNIPVNVLVGLEVLKAGHGWSDEEMYENYCYNLQVRYALGYDRLGDGDFAIRTLYNFRERLSKHHIETGINLLEQAFEQTTDAQIMDLQVRTGMQRMDSTQIASNIVYASRLRLLVEALPNLQERTDLDTLITDGGFGGEASDEALEGQPVKLIQTAIRGPKPDPQKFHLSDFDVQFDPQSTLTDITCPQGQNTAITPARTTGLQARFDHWR